jgi:general secretion pathway protein M
MIRRLLNTQFWRNRSVREQRLLLITTIFLLIGLIFSLLIEPALDGRHFWQKALPQLRSERAQMQALADQLGVKAAAPIATDARPIDRTQLERSLGDSAIKASSLEISGGLILLRCSDVSFDSLNRWLQQMHREQNYIVVDASIIARERAGQVDAAVSLRSLSTTP